jgi:hypothetical protein
MNNNYIRLGPPVEMNFIFFDTQDAGSIEQAKQQLEALRQQSRVVSAAIWEAHPAFPGIRLVGGPRPRS